MASCVRHVKNLRTILSRTHGNKHLLPSLNCPSTRALSTVHSRCVLLKSSHSDSHKHHRSTHNLGLSSILASTHHGSPLWMVSAVRHNSTGDSALPSGYIPEPPPVPVPDIATQIADQALNLNALGEPTLASLGLAAYTPPGLVQACLEAFHVMGGMPWWGAIVGMTVILRLCVFPLVIKSQKNAANMANHMPTVQRLQDKFSKARQGGNQMEAARTAQELMDYMKRNNVKPMRNLIVPLAQLPIFVSVFVGVRKMANLPVQSMTTGGMLWFTDLTITDPYYALPIITMLTFLATIELGTDGVKTGSVTPMMRTALRVMPFVMLPMIMNFPAAMLCYWFTSNVFSLSQVMFLKIPSVRAYFEIPQIVKHENSTVEKKKSFTSGFRDTIDNAKLAAEMKNREHMDAERFKRAAKGPVTKTYKHNPKARVEQKS